MAQDIGYDFAAGPTVTLLASDIANDGVSALTTAVDFGAPTPFGFGWKLVITGQTSAVNLAFLEIAWAHVNTAASFSDLLNLETVTSITCVASGDAVKAGASEVKAQFAKFRLLNKTGGVIDGTSSNTELLLYDIFSDQV